MSKLVHIAFGILVAVIAFMAAGEFRGFGGDVWVYFDNAGKEPMVVSVDDKEAATVAPGACEKVVFEPGERRFQIKCGDKVLFDGVKNLVKSDTLMVTPRFVFNPDGQSRYRTYAVEYGGGSSFLKDVIKGVITGGKEGEEKEERMDIPTAYTQLAAEPKLLPPSDWFPVGNVDYVLTDPPSHVMTRRGSTVKKTAMIRVERRDYDFILAARDKQNPTMDDLKELAEVVERVFDSEP